MASKAAARLRVEMVSDVLWPWCWVGKRELELAASRANVSLELVCKPFMLDPSLPAGGVDKVQSYIRKFGPQAEQWIKDPNNQIAVRGRSIGLEYQYHDGSKVFNSRKCHLLLTWAVTRYSVDAQRQLKEVLLRKYLRDGKNLGADEELLEAVREVPELPEDVAKKVLAGTLDDFDDLEETFEEQLADGHRRTSGVPAFYFPDGTNFSGAQPAAVMDRAIARALAHAK